MNIAVKKIYSPKVVLKVKYIYLTTGVTNDPPLNEPGTNGL